MEAEMKMCRSILNKPLFRVLFCIYGSGSLVGKGLRGHDCQKGGEEWQKICFMSAPRC